MSEEEAMVKSLSPPPLSMAPATQCSDPHSLMPTNQLVKTEKIQEKTGRLAFVRATFCLSTYQYTWAKFGANFLYLINSLINFQST